MAEYTIKELKGFSGSKIYLMRGDKGLFIRKMDNTDRNYIKLKELSENFNVPKIYSVGDNVLDMEYIHGLDMKSYLAVRNGNRLTDFIVDMLKNFSEENKISCASVRLFNVYGLRARTTGAYGAMFGVFLAQKLNNKEKENNNG